MKYFGTHDFSGATVTGVPGISPYQCTVGATGADYTTLGAAVAASKSRILVIGNTTETANIALPAGTCIIHGLGSNLVNVNMGDYIFTIGTSTELSIERVKFTTVFTTAKTLISDHPKLIVRDCYFDQNGTQAGSKSIYSVTSTNIVHIENTTFELPNFNDTGLGLSTLSTGVGYKGIVNCSIVGTGSGSALGSISNSQINGITFSGSFTTNPSANFSDGCIVNNFDSQTVNNFVLRVGDAVLNNITMHIGSNSYIQHWGEAKISNFKIGNIMYGAIFRVEWNNGFIGNNIYLDYTLQKFTNVVMLAGITIASGGNNNYLNNCRVGSAAGGGATTITIQAGATNTVIDNCYVDADISDSGTNTSAAYIIY